MTPAAGRATGDHGRVRVTTTAGEAHGRGHMLRELGFGVFRSGGTLVGTGEVRPPMHVPGTRHLRTAVLVTWLDMLAGLLAAEMVAPRVPVTVELDVHLHRPAPGAGPLHGTGRSLKAGRSVFVARVDFSDDQGTPVATGAASFMVSPDLSVRLPEDLSIDVPATGELLSVPLAERAGCERRRPGVAWLPRSEDGLNAAQTVNGGLLALVAEEAVLGLVPGATIASMAMRYLQPVRRGPAVATARLAGEVATVEVRDAGAGERLAVMATARTFAP